MISWDSIKGLTEWFPVPLILAALGVIWRYLKPRRLLSFVAAVKERETMIASAEYWQAEAMKTEELRKREESSGLRWKAQHDICQEEIMRLDAECVRLRTRLTTCENSNAGSGRTS